MKTTINYTAILSTLLAFAGSAVAQVAGTTATTSSAILRIFEAYRFHTECPLETLVSTIGPWSNPDRVRIGRGTMVTDTIAREPNHSDSSNLTARTQ